MLFVQMSYLILLFLFFTCVLCESYVIQPGTWNFRGHPIAFERAELSSASSAVNNQIIAANSKSVIVDDTVTEERGADLAASGSLTQTTIGPYKESVPIVLLNGFGVGSFHQHRLIHELFDSEETKHILSKDLRIYCIDYLGQGKSWPKDCQDGQGANEINLRYCGQTWVDQITSFIEEVVLPSEEDLSNSAVCKKVHIVGNSIGGHLAVFVAAKRPDLVESLALLNATPVWGLNLPGWSGRLPAPWLPKMIGRYLFDRIRDLNTIEKYLETAYFNRAAFGKTLIQQIRGCTEGNGGHAAFASILWSPPIAPPASSEGKSGKGFYLALACLECDVLLLFGRDDPWCKPAFAKRMLEQVPNHVAARYVECTEVGHCPNHEAPVATAQVLQEWWKHSRAERMSGAPLVNKPHVEERWGRTTLQERQTHEIELSVVDRLAVAFV